MIMVCFGTSSTKIASQQTSWGCNLKICLTCLLSLFSHTHTHTHKQTLLTQHFAARRIAGVPGIRPGFVNGWAGWVWHRCTFGLNCNNITFINGLSPHTHTHTHTHTHMHSPTHMHTHVVNFTSSSSWLTGWGCIVFCSVFVITHPCVCPFVCACVCVCESVCVHKHGPHSVRKVNLCGW